MSLKKISTDILEINRVLKKEFDLVLLGQLPAKGVLDNYGRRINFTRSFNGGAQISLPSIMVKDRLETNDKLKKFIINFSYNVSKDMFEVLPDVSRKFTASNGEEYIISDNEFYRGIGKRREDKKEYLFRLTDQEITVEEYKKLPRVSRDIESIAIEYLLEYYRFVLKGAEYRSDSSNLTDSRVDYDGYEVLRFNNDQLKAITNKINNFIDGRATEEKTEETNSLASTGEIPMNSTTESKQEENSKR